MWKIMRKAGIRKEYEIELKVHTKTLIKIRYKRGEKYYGF